MAISCTPNSSAAALLFIAMTVSPLVDAAPVKRELSPLGALTAAQAMPSAHSGLGLVVVSALQVTPPAPGASAPAQEKAPRPSHFSLVDPLLHPRGSQFLQKAAAVPVVADELPVDEDSKAMVKDPKEFAMFEVWELLATIVIWSFLYATAAVYYHKYVITEPEPEKSEEGKDLTKWTSGIFACSEDWPIFFWSCCCPGIRWADTMSEIGVHKYWPAFAMFTALYFLAAIPGVTWISWALVVAYCTFHRQEFRKKFEFTEVGGKSLATDCGLYCCCMWCAVAQEARMVKEACKVGSKVIEREEWKTAHKNSARAEKKEAESS